MLRRTLITRSNRLIAYCDSYSCNQVSSHNTQLMLNMNRLKYRTTLLTSLVAAAISNQASSLHTATVQAPFTNFRSNSCFMQTFHQSKSLILGKTATVRTLYGDRNHQSTTKGAAVSHNTYNSSTSSLKSTKYDNGDNNNGPRSSFYRGQLIQVEVSRFGKLGASVDIIGLGHGANDLIGDEDPALGTGLVLQSEITYFRRSRGMVDVLVGEVLPAYVENLRENKNVDETVAGRRLLIDVSLRPPGNAKAMNLANEIMDRLQSAPDGTIPVGDKSAPLDIDAQFPGASKSAFKKAVSSLYRTGKVKPSPGSITLM